MIPKFPSQQDDGGGKPTDVFAYISVEDASDPGEKTKHLLGKIRKCNLTTSKLAAAVILKEVCSAKSSNAQFLCISDPYYEV